MFQAHMILNLSNSSRPYFYSEIGEILLVLLDSCNKNNINLVVKPISRKPGTPKFPSHKLYLFGITKYKQYVTYSHKT